jgi:ABC-type branched-subunit amino acid transport system substrate-binding protein
MAMPVKGVRAWVAIAALMLTACGGSLGGGGDQGGGGQAGGEGGGGPLKIGVITGLTGAYVQLGEEQANGAQLAAEVLGNMAGDRPLEIIVRDDQLTPEAALQQAQSLVQEEQVHFLTGCVSAATTLAVNQVAKEAGVPYLGTCQTEQLNRPPHFDPATTYHLAPATSININAAVPWICGNLGRRIFLLEADYAWGHEQNAAYQKAVTAAGCEIVGTAWFPLGTTDFNPYIPTVEGSGAEVIVFGGAGRDQVNFLRQAGQFGLTERFKVFLNLAEFTFDQELGFDLVDGTYGMSHFYWTIDDPGVQEFVSAYQERYGRPPGGYSVFLYNAINLIAEQVAAGNDSPEAFRQAVEDMEFSYAQGTQVMRACDHQALAPVYILEGLAADEAATRGDSPQHGFREIVETIPGSDQFAPSCDEVQQEFVPARP